MKRSQAIKLVLLGGLSAGALAGCDSRIGPPPVSAEAAYTNNYLVPGVGYYHAPFRQWYPLPYNYFDPARRQYFFGGQWSSVPGVSITNISSPDAYFASLAEAHRNDLPPPVARGGFGSSSGYRSTWS